ncbi:integrase, catalytic region, zinc finger, CCHC-type containing protein [Tanacetum coccineum]
MTGNLKLLINFVWKFMGVVRFGNDHIAAILDLEVAFRRRKIFDLQVYVVEAWHNLFGRLAVRDSRFREVTPSSYGFCAVPMKFASIKESDYCPAIIDDYSRYTWVHFLRSKDEAPKVIKIFLKKIQVLLQALVIIIRTDNRTEFTNQVLKAYFDSVGISHQTSPVRTPQQNGVVERRNQTLVEAARTIFDKTPYELINNKKPDISFLHVFEALCYPKNDREDIGKLGAKAIAFEQHSSKPELQGMTSRHISSGLAITPCERIEKTKRSKNDQKPTRNGKKTKSQEQDKEISQRSQPDQPDSVKERNKGSQKPKVKSRGHYCQVSKD